MLTHMATLRALGVRLILPRELKHLVRPRAVQRARGGGDERAPKSFQTFLDMQALLTFDWQVRVKEYCKVKAYPFL